MKKNNLIKRYFLRYITSTFAVCFLSLVVAASAVAVGVYRLPPDRLGDLSLAPLSMLGVAGLEVVLVVLHVVGARLLVSYERGSWLYLKIRPDGVVEDSGNPMWKGWVQKGVEIRRVWLPPIDRTHSVVVAVGPFPVVLEIDFQYPFDPQEVCDVIVRGSDFNSWLAAVVNAVANSSVAVQRIRDDLDQPPAARLMDFTVALGKVLRSEEFKSRLLGNIRRPINVTVSSSAKFAIN